MPAMTSARAIASRFRERKRPDRRGEWRVRPVPIPGLFGTFRRVLGNSTLNPCRLTPFSIAIPTPPFYADPHAWYASRPAWPGAFRARVAAPDHLEYLALAPGASGVAALRGGPAGRWAGGLDRGGLAGRGGLVVSKAPGSPFVRRGPGRGRVPRVRALGAVSSGRTAGVFAGDAGPGIRCLGAARGRSTHPDPRGTGHGASGFLGLDRTASPERLPDNDRHGCRRSGRSSFPGALWRCPGDFRRPLLPLSRETPGRGPVDRTDPGGARTGLPRGHPLSGRNHELVHPSTRPAFPCCWRSARRWELPGW